MATKRDHKVTGFVLLELIVALTLIGVGLMFLGQWYAQQQQLSTRQTWVYDTELLISALQTQWQQTHKVPSDLSQLSHPDGSSGFVEPWQQTWQVLPQAEHLQLQIAAPNHAEARWFASQLPGARAVQEQVFIEVLEPDYSQVANAERFLHRQPQPQQPELNEMQVDLQMNGHALTNVSQLQATSASVTMVQSDLVQTSDFSATHARIEHLEVDSLISPEGSLLQLKQQLDLLQALWNSCVAQGRCG
ncbi:type II secretion system protein [Pseudidiomarina taiwanensis]|uniref:Type II secretion system protein n=1 Tax=Pseudidiomarina taiwanensis TaxID=337250 RepID=A0A432ZJW1_9GAMM|nr:type II secretion system protein [Pseudidiomarina taiwanensis]RUO78256.1 hypothetical protein CWI83_04280 [Pseudidiomarina taiwanensis]